MGPFIFLDTETTGIDPNRDHIIEFAAIKWEDGKIAQRYETLINPRIPLPYEITLLTGITDKDLKDAPLFPEVKEKILDFLGDFPIIGHNIAFDAAFLKSHHLDLKNPEIDTVALGRILLLKEPSYALEVLMKKYGLNIRASHRAMADTETAVEFFEFLLNKISEIPKEVMNKMKPILEKTQWAGKEVFNIIASHSVIASPSMQLGVNSAKQSIQTKNNTQTQASAAHNWSEDTTANFLQGRKILLESSEEIPFSTFKKYNRKLLIAYSTFRKRDEIVNKAQAENLTATILKEPSLYLSPQKFALKCSAPSFSAEETPLLLKLLLWIHVTQTGDREEISLEREEYGLFDLLADDGGNDVFFKKAIEHAQNTDIILIHHYALGNKLTTHFSDRSLVIVEASRLEENLTNAFKHKFTVARLRPMFEEKATMLFGLMGIFYEHFVREDDGGFKGNVVLDAELRNSMQWQRVLQSIENLPDHPKKVELKKALAENQNTICWINAFMNEIALHCAPIALGNLFQQVVAPFSSIALQSDALSGDGTFGLVEELFELDSAWIKIKATSRDQNLDIKIPSDFPQPYSDGYFKKCIALFTQIIAEKRGRALLMLSSKKMVDAMYGALLPKVEQSVKLLGVGYSGGVGKSLALFKENPANSVLIATPQIIQHLAEIENDIEVIVFQKIPFDPPNDPLLANRASQFANGFEQYTLPRAIMKFKELLIELGSTESPKTCYILDSRLHTRDYGRMFI